MHAIAYEEFGAASVLKLVEVPLPKRNPGEVLVKVHAAGVNPIDYKVRSGTHFPKFLVSRPQTPGGDFAGVVEETDESSKFLKGQKVFALTDGRLFWRKEGTYAEYFSVKEPYLAHQPASLSFEEAGGVPLAALTAYQALETAGVHEGQRVLIHAGAGGVGSFGIQLAKARGAHVITTAGPRNIDFVKQELGADEAIEYTSSRFEQVLKSNPVDVVIDTMAGDYEARSVSILKPRGHYQQIMNENLSVPRVLARFVKGALRFGPSYGVTIVKPNGDQLQKIADLISEGKVKVVVDKVFLLKEAASAHEYLEKGHARGKVVLKVD